MCACVCTLVCVCVYIAVHDVYSEQLMMFHQSLFAAMMRIDQSTDAQISSEFLNMLDKFLPGLTVYTPFLALGQQTFQHVSLNYCIYCGHLNNQNSCPNCK